MKENISTRKESMGAQTRASIAKNVSILSSQDSRKSSIQSNKRSARENSDAARKDFLGKQRRMSEEIGKAILKGMKLTA